MYIDSITVGDFRTNVYIITDEVRKVSVVIDPGFEVDKIIDFINMKGYKVEYILLTHGHFDHVMEANLLKEEFKCKIFANINTKVVIADSRHNLSEEFLNKKLRVDVDKYLQDGEEFNIGSKRVKQIYIGGHTIDSSCYYFEDESIIFTGDSLFYESVGRTDLYMSDFETQKNNINKKLLCLPGKTIVYPGHGKTTSIEHENNNNKYLR